MTKPSIAPLTETRFSRWERIYIRIALARKRLRIDWEFFSQDRLAIFGLILILMFAIMAIAHPILMKTVWPRRIYDPFTGFDLDEMPHPTAPSAKHILGTDSLGRDVLSTLLAATTPTFTIGLTAALTTAVIATIFSMLAAFYRGKADLLITNLADVVLLLPPPILMIIVGARFRDLGPVPLGLVYGLTTGAGSATLVLRSQALKIAAKPFMEASHIAGGRGGHIILKHFLPNMLPMAALQMMLAVTGAVVADGFISFFGLRRLTSNWGTLIYDAFLYANIGGSGPQWHVLIPTAMAFTLFALAFYLVSRGLHKVADPKLREDWL
ncbi:MAG TPA: ABC transporter permease [Anaerolineae bacterium]|nr:ABC transporter permease [Anaerolineae bacterium]